MAGYNFVVDYKNIAFIILITFVIIIVIIIESLNYSVIVCSFCIFLKWMWSDFKVWLSKIFCILNFQSYVCVRRLDNWQL